MPIASNSQLVTVMYHYVRDVVGSPFPNIKATTPHEFRRQLEDVRRSFQMPSLEGCLDFLSGAWDPAVDLCLLTFDDGLRDHYENVFPILKRAGVTGAFFLPTAAIGGRRMLAVHISHFLLADIGSSELEKRVRALAGQRDIPLPPDPELDVVAATYRWDSAETARFKYLMNYQLLPEVSESLLRSVFVDILGDEEEFAQHLYMTWEEASEMQDSGFSIGGHTHHHRVLTQLTESEQQDDLTQSTDLISSYLGSELRAFAYPYGKPSTYSSKTIELLKDLGYCCAFGTSVAHASHGDGLWEIPRIDPKDL
jgi:peptidoglycan/xylan/chitin deacetylase (PgdA/CDA1 family)